MKKSLFIFIAFLVIIGTAILVSYAPLLSATQNSTAIEVANSTEIIKQTPFQPSKLSVKDKMLSAIDYYQDVQGTYLNKTQTRDVVVTFEVQEGNDPYSHIKITDRNGIKKESISDSNSILDLYPDTKSYIISKKTKTSEISLSSRQTKNERNEPVFKFRGDPASPQDAMIVTFPQQIAFWLNDDTKNYKVIGNEQFLNREASVVEGTLSSGLANKFKASDFKLWVDSDTGILLKLITTNEDNEVTSTIEVTSLKVDSGIGEKLNTNVPEGYNEDK